MNTKARTAVQLASIAFTFPEGVKEVSYKTEKVFRGGRIYTSVDREGLGFIDGLYFGDDPMNHCLGPFNAWDFSIIRIQAARKEFLEEHGLTGKTSQEIQDYLDENELSMPDVPLLEFPTLDIGETVRMTAQFSVPVNVSFMGYVRG